MELFDSHAHYDDEKFNEDRDFIINEIYKSGVTKFVSAGYSLESSKIGIELAKKYDFIYTTSGISPNDIPATNDELESQLLEIEKIAKSNSKVVAIGEIGLDYYWNKENKDDQKDLFIKQLDLAIKYDLPVIIHTRDSIQDCYDILKDRNNRGVIHCFTGSIEMAKLFIKKGYKLGIGGVLTFKNSNLYKVIESIDLDDILLETDSPFLSPAPFRGQTNIPSNVYYVASRIAEIKNISVEEVINITRKNASKLFDINLN